MLTTVIEGRTTAELYMTAINRKLVSRLDHAAYLGRELARAEGALTSGERYIQDAAPEADVRDPRRGQAGLRRERALPRLRGEAGVSAVAKPAGARAAATASLEVLLTDPAVSGTRRFLALAPSRIRPLSQTPTRRFALRAD